jgi:hypothetical protein
MGIASLRGVGEASRGASTTESMDSGSIEGVLRASGLLRGRENERAGGRGFEETRAGLADGAVWS